MEHVGEGVCFVMSEGLSFHPMNDISRLLHVSFAMILSGHWDILWVSRKSLSGYHTGDQALGTVMEIWGSLREKLVLVKEG